MSNGSSIMDCCQSAATIEGFQPDAGDGVRKGNGGESGGDSDARRERPLLDAGNGVSDGDGGESAATIKRRIPDGGD